MVGLGISSWLIFWLYFTCLIQRITIPSDRAISSVLYYFDLSSGSKVKLKSAEIVMQDLVYKISKVYEDSNEFCVVCHEKQAKVLYLPCKHLIVCEECDRKELSECATCRAKIEQKMYGFTQFNC